jgi:hypothetical protein
MRRCLMNLKSHAFGPTLCTSAQPDWKFVGHLSLMGWSAGTPDGAGEVVPTTASAVLTW